MAAALAILLLRFLSPLLITAATQLQTEPELLLTFKSSILDPLSSLSTWTKSNTSNLCNWHGVGCSRATPPSVISLALEGLNLSGEISPSICRLPQLTHLSLSGNLFNIPIPLHLSQCSKLETLNLSGNLFWGTVPDQIFSLLISLKSLDFGGNRLEGRISKSVGNLSELTLLDLSDNPFLVGEVPAEIGQLRQLKRLFLQRSGFGGRIPRSLLGLNRLEVLDLSQNNFTGDIPLGFGSALAKIVSIDLSQNGFSGSFPAGICHGTGLREISLHTNLFSGKIPDSFEECRNLERFQVQNNGFIGDFPDGIWFLPKLKLIRAENNRFSGEIPSSISAAARFEQVQIDNNSFTGSIPRVFGRIGSIYRFSASLNRFSGNLPEDFCESQVMSIINLSHNSISGRIPELRHCRKLVSLSLANNSFIGGIPATLAELPVLTYIDLSSNFLTGKIPPGLQNLKLALFNVSFNRLSGRVPSPLISGLPASFLQGNPGLCGPGLPNTCPDPDERLGSVVPSGESNRPSRATLALIWVGFGVGIVFLIAGFIAIYRSFRKRSASGHREPAFFYPLGVTEQELEKGLDEKNAVSAGAFGRTYVIQLQNGEFVAVKRIVNFGDHLSWKALKAEIKILANVRHRNVAKLLGFCCSKDSILLIYEHAQMGSLGDSLGRPDLLLQWDARLRIAIGAAQGLAYLHQGYVPHLLHRDVKSRNVVLDMDFQPKLTHFGLDRVVGESAYQTAMASELSDRVYMAPEQGISKRQTEQMDVFSFGVVLLELVTGRPAERPRSEDGIDVVKWVRRKINMRDGNYEVLDSRVPSSWHGAMLDALEIALCCISVIPEKRPTMSEVVRRLQSIESKSRASQS